MGEKQRVSGSIEIAASPETVYAMVTDLPRMGEWSPENQGGTWAGGATKAAPGTKFKGKNKHGKKSWTVAVQITDVTPDTRFAFTTIAGPIKVCDWIYEITPTATGCSVTETWVDTRAPGLGALGKVISGVADRATHNKASIDTTLANLKKAAESGS